jgi:hypothetical protein
MNMKKFLLALLALAAMQGAAFAQVVTKLPIVLQNNIGQVADLGNGPLEIRVIQGSAQLFTSQGSGVGTAAASTALTLTATPATPPIVGGFITCNAPTNCTIPANTTVTAFNGTTGVTLSAASTITAVQVNWGAACPALPTGLFPIINAQANVGADLPLFTQARICGASQYAAGAEILTFAIGAH